MPKQFGGHPFDLHPVDVPNWELLERIERLLRPYLDPSAALGDLDFTGEDPRGMIVEATVDDLRLAFEDDDRTPTHLKVSLSTLEMHVAVRMSNTVPPGASVTSNREELVTHVTARLKDLFERTNAEEGARRRAAMEEAERRAAQALPQHVVGENVPGRRGAFLRDLSVEALGGLGAGLLLILALAVWATFVR